MNSKRRTTRSTSTVDETRAAPRVESTGASILSGASSTSVLGGEIINSQRDHNRATFIINLGGSDSETSRSTLTVSNPATSGSVGDSPHASTSSSVRDLPCSSTPPASNQEQSSLEEFSVSTDSGLGGSEVSSEVESPPTKEGHPVEKESSNTIYNRHMYLEAHGFPLWIPQPNMTLPRSYQRQGVSIGDVGVFTPDGGFDFLFNVCLPAGHPSNPNALPEGFVPLELKPTDVRKFYAHSSHSHLASPSVKRRDRATFECSGSDGAILAMPQGAYHQDLKNIRKFREYTLIHAESWYVYAKGLCGEEIGNGELHLVTGCDKTTSWGIATYSHLPSKRPEDNVPLLRFNPVGNERRGRHSSYTTYEWDYAGVAEAKFGPEGDELMDLGVDGSVPPGNQCTFIRSLAPAFGKDDWQRLEFKVESSVKDQATVRSPKSTFSSVSGAISSFSSRISFLRGHSRGGSSEVTDSVTPAKTTGTHPATYVIDMMLRKCPKAKVVVVHDSDWCSVIRDSDDDWTYTAQELPRRIQEIFHIVEEENGAVYLEEKTRLSQDLGTSSDISVKLEVEDLPLFEDRKPGPSQHFSSFETSLSDMEVDSPRSFKKILDGDEDIKPTTYHDFGEGDDNDLGDGNLSLLEDRKSWPSKLFDCFEISPLDMKDDFLSVKKKIADWDDIKSNKYHISTSEDEEDHLGDENDLEPDAAFLEFILRRIQQVKHDNKKPSLFPRSLKTLPDESEAPGSGSSTGCFGRDAGHEETLWSDAFSNYISLQIQKLKNNSFSKESFFFPPSDCDGDNKFNQQHDSNKLETDHLDNKHRVLLNAITRVIVRRMKNDDNDLKDCSLPLCMKQSTDNRDDHARPDLFDGSAKANLESLKGKLIHRDTKLNVPASSNDEDYLMSDASSELTSQTYGRQTVSGGDVMPFTDLSGSSGPGESPMVRELLGNTLGRYHVFVGDLSPDINDDILAMAFIAFGSISDARVLWNNDSGKSHGYGFLAFEDKADAERAIAIMNGKRLGSREIRVSWANQEIQRVPPTTTASSNRPVTSGSAAPSPSGSECGRSLHGPLPLLGEPRNNRRLVDEGFLEEVEALDYRPYVPTSGSSDHLEGFPGPLLPDPEDSNFSPDALPYRKTVASPARIMASQARRKNGRAKFTCSLCTQTFTTNTNLKNHLNVHQGIKDHRCRCSSAFTTRAALRRHLRTCKGSPEPMQQPSPLKDALTIAIEELLSSGPAQVDVLPFLEQLLLHCPPVTSTPAADPGGSSALSNAYRPPQSSRELGTLPLNPHLLF